MCIGKSVSSQLTGVFESPEETAAQPCPVSAGLLREPRAHAQLHACPVSPGARGQGRGCTRRIRSVRGLASMRPRPWPGPASASGALPRFRVGPEASGHTQLRPSARLTVFTWFYICFQTDFSSSGYFFLTPFLLFPLSPLVDMEKDEIFKYL